MIKLGSHISFKAPNYLPQAVQEALSYGANTMMIYLGAPQNARRVNVEKYHYQTYLKLKPTIASVDIIVHAPYIINPASVEKHQFAIEFLIQEIKRMNYIQAKYLVLHPGAHTSFSRQEAIHTLVKSLRTVLSQTKNVVIALETMAGKGTEIGTSFAELATIIQQVNNPRLAICLDTCHLWEAGIDITNYDQLIKDLEKHKLLKLVKVIHLNDSKNPLGAHKDRHENIGQGQIGLKALKKIVRSPEFAHVPKILETPWVNQKPIYQHEIALLNSV